MDPARNEPASTSDLRRAPDGILLASKRGRRRLLVRKEGTEIQLLFDSEGSCETQSRLDLDSPLDLLSAYTRAAMLFLLWREAPRHVHVIGLAGGRAARSTLRPLAKGRGVLELAGKHGGRA